MINYKVDLDVAGEDNSLLFTHTHQETVEHPWFEDDWGSSVLQQKITRTYIESENDALLKFPYNFQGGYALVNKDALNKWGTPRGYAIHPGYNPVHNVGLPRVFITDADAQRVTDGRRFEALARERQLGAVQPRCEQAQGDGADQQQHVEPEPARRPRRQLP